MKEWYRHTQSVWFVLAILIPTLSLFWFYAVGRFMEPLGADTQWLASLKLDTNWPDAAEAALIAAVKSISLTVFIIIAAIVYCGRQLRTLIQNRSGMLNITYADGSTVLEPRTDTAGNQA